MGAGASTAIANSLSPHTMKKGRRKNRDAMQEGCKTMSEELMEKYDVSKSGTLLPEEVKAIAVDLLREATPLVGGVTDEDIQMVMKLGGESVKPSITIKEIPTALAQLMWLKAENTEYVELFRKYDTDSSGFLPHDQLANLLTDLNEDVRVSDAEVEYVMAQSVEEGKEEKGITLEKLKPALAAWYCAERDMQGEVEQQISSAAAPSVEEAAAAPAEEAAAAPAAAPAEEEAAAPAMAEEVAPAAEEAPAPAEA
mmetsp:Transcript_32570/g.85824  ORF Transcript_32570/g.85824 Transcript_32570/m.85824 type:complete len:254 (-) Transcript_32570:290-1051(-)